MEIMLNNTNEQKKMDKVMESNARANKKHITEHNNFTWNEDWSKLHATNSHRAKHMLLQWIRMGSTFEMIENQ